MDLEVGRLFLYYLMGRLMNPDRRSANRKQTPRYNFDCASAQLPARGRTAASLEARRYSPRALRVYAFAYPHLGTSAIAYAAPR
jgi:hypothetical protein